MTSAPQLSFPPLASSKKTARPNKPAPKPNVTSTNGSTVDVPTNSPVNNIIATPSPQPEIPQDLTNKPKEASRPTKPPPKTPLTHSNTNSNSPIEEQNSPSAIPRHPGATGKSIYTKKLPTLPNGKILPQLGGLKKESLNSQSQPIPIPGKTTPLIRAQTVPLVLEKDNGKLTEEVTALKTHGKLERSISENQQKMGTNIAQESQTGSTSPVQGSREIAPKPGGAPKKPLNTVQMIKPTSQGQLPKLSTAGQKMNFHPNTPRPGLREQTPRPNMPHKPIIHLLIEHKDTNLTKQNSIYKKEKDNKEGSLIQNSIEEIKVIDNKVQNLRQSSKEGNGEKSRIEDTPKEISKEDKRVDNGAKEKAARQNIKDSGNAKGLSPRTISKEDNQEEVKKPTSNNISKDDVQEPTPNKFSKEDNVREPTPNKTSKEDNAKELTPKAISKEDKKEEDNVKKPTPNKTKEDKKEEDKVKKSTPNKTKEDKKEEDKVKKPTPNKTKEDKKAEDNVKESTPNNLLKGDKKEEVDNKNSDTNQKAHHGVTAVSIASQEPKKSSEEISTKSTADSNKNGQSPIQRSLDKSSNDRLKKSHHSKDKKKTSLKT